MNATGKKGRSLTEAICGSAGRQHLAVQVKEMRTKCRKTVVNDWFVCGFARAPGAVPRVRVFVREMNC